MSESRFTQGPWGLSKRCGSERVVIAEELDDDGEYYGDIPICFTTCQCVDINEAYANARLIAAAPEMYEAAVEVLEYQCKVCRHPELCDDCLFGKLKAAVAKVKGGAE